MNGRTAGTRAEFTAVLILIQGVSRMTHQHFSPPILTPAGRSFPRHRCYPPDQTSWYSPEPPSAGHCPRPTPCARSLFSTLFSRPSIPTSRSLPVAVLRRTLFFYVTIVDALTSSPPLRSPSVTVVLFASIPAGGRQLHLRAHLRLFLVIVL